MLPQICKADFKVTSYMADFQNRLRLSMLLGLQQETAFQHAAVLIREYGPPSAEASFWVTTQSWTTVTRLPSVNEHIHIETWLRHHSRLVCRRNFAVTSSEGEPLAQTAMDWVVLSAATRRPLRVDAWPVDRGLFLESPLGEIEGRRMTPFPEILPSYQRVVRYSEIDLNKHVNNTRYIDWILDSFDLDFLAQKKISHMHLCYKQECTLGNRLTILKGKVSADEYYLEAHLDHAESPAFQAMVTFT